MSSDSSDQHKHSGPIRRSARKKSVSPYSQGKKQSSQSSSESPEITSPIGQLSLEEYQKKVQEPSEFDSFNPESLHILKEDKNMAPIPSNNAEGFKRSWKDDFLAAIALQGMSMSPGDLDNLYDQMISQCGTEVPLPAQAAVLFSAGQKLVDRKKDAEIIRLVSTNLPESVANFSQVVGRLGEITTVLSTTAENMSKRLEPSDFRPDDIHRIAEFSYDKMEKQEKIATLMLYLHDVVGANNVYTLAGSLEGVNLLKGIIPDCSSSLATIYRQWGTPGINTFKDTFMKESERLRLKYPELRPESAGNPPQA